MIDEGEKREQGEAPSFLRALELWRMSSERASSLIKKEARKKRPLTDEDEVHGHGPKSCVCVPTMDIPATRFFILHHLEDSNSLTHSLLSSTFRIESNRRFKVLEPPVHTHIPSLEFSSHGTRHDTPPLGDPSHMLVLLHTHSISENSEYLNTYVQDNMGTQTCTSLNI